MVELCFVSQAMEKKKTMEELQRRKDVNAASQQAFMKAVSKNKPHSQQKDRSYK